jgi:Ser/Thr protein kinase RdoA (MazF antagonist)
MWLYFGGTIIRLFRRSTKRKLFGIDVLAIGSKYEINRIMNSIATCPTFSKEEALFFLKKEWGIYGLLKPLDSYLDQNFLVQNEQGKKFVLKIANIETPEDWLDLQNKALIHLQSDSTPKIVLSKSGSQMLFCESHWWRVLEFIEGTMLSSVPFRSNGLLKNIGYFAGNISKKLSTFSHLAAERPIQ